MTRIKYKKWIPLFILTLVACDDWLKVTPSNQLTVEEQIETVNGFIDMLNGVYIGMAQRDLYAEHMMFGDIEFLAQNHHPDNNIAIGFEEYNYVDVRAIERIEDYWNSLYNVIANVNIILDAIDNKREIFIEDDFNVIKGEALALRAFLHFDVLRLFGESYSESTRSNKQIPYVETSDLVPTSSSTMDSVYIKVLRDLDQAQKLLGESDPQIASYGGRSFTLEERVYHLNYHAVNALKARVFITRGSEDKNDYDSAYFYSDKVLTEMGWAFVTDGELNDNFPLFYQELIWRLNVSSLDLIHQQTFGSITNNSGYKTAMEVDFNGANKIYDVIMTGGLDRRYNHQLGPDPDNFSQHSVSLKFAQVEFNALDLDAQFFSVPMISGGEIHLTKSEASLRRGNRQEAIDLLNELKIARRVDIPDPSYLGVFDTPFIEDHIVPEYRKELFMEGQTFLIYKRLNMQTIPNGVSLNGTIELSPEDYILPIPFAERELGD